MKQELKRIVALLALIPTSAAISQTISETLPGTKPLNAAAGWREEQQRQIVRYFERRIEATAVLRDRAWTPDYSSVPAYSASLLKHRLALRKMLGVSAHGLGEAQVRTLAPHAEEVRIELERDFFVRALVFTPESGAPTGAVIAVPPETETAERFASSPWVTSLVAKGLVVAVPAFIDRSENHPLCRQLNVRNLREILHRYAFITGHTLTGLEVEQTTALRKYLAARGDVDPQRISILGGMTAFYAAAADEAFASATIIDYFEQRERSWAEPFDHTLYGQLNEFGDAEVAALIAPRPLTIVRTPDGAIAEASVAAEMKRAARFFAGVKAPGHLQPGSLPEPGPALSFHPSEIQIEQARNEQFTALHRYLLRICEESDRIRRSHWKLTDSRPEDAAPRLRRALASLEGIPGDPPAPMNPRTRLLRITDKFVAYEVMLGVLPGVEVYGHLLVPRIVGKRLPAVICQHGLDGQPKDTDGLGEKLDPVYHVFASDLAGRGYVVFSPYVTVPFPQKELINPIVRMAASLGGMRTGLEVRKLRRVVDFLESQPFVNSARIGYYGLSYGGYSTAWMGSMEPRLRAVIISGHFNDWRAKITNEVLPTSYMMYADEDFYNWNVLNSFTHPELIAAMWPRAVMVEWADRDPTTTPEWHRKAWNEVYEIARAWHGEDRLVRDAFLGKHEIGGMGSFDFLDRWLRPERAARREYVYSLFPAGTARGMEDVSENTWPCIRHELDASPGSVVRGTFHVASVSPLFQGMSIQLSRVGNPGPVILRFGSREGAADLGEARISGVEALYDLWYDARVPARHLDPARLYYVELRAETGKLPDDYYYLWGPRPLGGRPQPGNFGYSFRLLGDEKHGEDTHEFVKRYLAPPRGGAPVPAAGSKPAGPGEITITRDWSIEIASPADDVLKNAQSALREFFADALGIELAQRGTKKIRIEAGGAPGVTTAEGCRITSSPGGVVIRGGTSRGAMRGTYWLEDQMRLRGGPILAKGAVARNERFPRRITTSILPGGERYDETSRPLLYSDGLLEKISRDGFNGIWVWINTEEAAVHSKIFPELDDPYALVRFARLEDLARRAHRYGIDVWLYLATGYHQWIPELFYKSHPEGLAACNDELTEFLRKFR